jgi:hypothetical protein
MAVFPYVYVIAQDHAGGVEWPVFATSGGPALVAFTNPDAARRFCRSRGLSPGWRIGGMVRDEFLRWLRHNLGSGTRLLALNPEPGAERHLVLPIDRLVEAAGR